MRFPMRVGGLALVAVSAWLALAGCQRPAAPQVSGPTKQVTVAISGMN